MFDTVAFYESRAGTAAATGVTALADPHVATSGDQITVPAITGGAAQLVYAMAGITNASDTIAFAQFSAPSLRATSLIDIPVLQISGVRTTVAGAEHYDPYAASTTWTMPTDPAISWFINANRVLTPGEGLENLVASSGTTAACLHTTVVGLGNGNYVNPYQGIPIETVRVTNTANATANTWTNLGSSTQTVTQTLRAGRYAILGLKAFNTTCQSARFVLGETPHRPGCIGVTGVTHKGDPLFRQGNLGEWGQFVHTNFPSFDVLCNAADSGDFTFYVDMVKIA